MKKLEENLLFSFGDTVKPVYMYYHLKPKLTTEADFLNPKPGILEKIGRRIF